MPLCRHIVSSTNDYNVYDALDVIDRNAAKIFQRMNTCITRGAGRSSKVVFYDVTNFFFEIPNPDDELPKPMHVLQYLYRLARTMHVLQYLYRLARAMHVLQYLYRLLFDTLLRSD